MGILDSSSIGKPADQLKEQHQELKRIIDQAATTRGPASNPLREQLVTKWLGNFARNLEAAATALATGRDMHMQPISPQQIAGALVRMCDEFGKPELVERLGQVCDQQVKQRFQAVLDNVKTIAASI